MLFFQHSRSLPGVASSPSIRPVQRGIGRARQCFRGAYERRATKCPEQKLAEGLAISAFHSEADDTVERINLLIEKLVFALAWTAKRGYLEKRPFSQEYLGAFVLHLEVGHR